MPNYSACNACSSSLLHSINFHWLSQAFVSGVFHFTGFYFQRCLLINAEKWCIPIGSGLHRKLAWPTVMQVYSTWQQPFFSKLRMWGKKKKKKVILLEKTSDNKCFVSVKHQNSYIFIHKLKKAAFTTFSHIPCDITATCFLYMIASVIKGEPHIPAYATFKASFTVF